MAKTDFVLEKKNRENGQIRLSEKRLLCIFKSLKRLELDHTESCPFEELPISTSGAWKVRQRTLRQMGVAGYCLKMLIRGFFPPVFSPPFLSLHSEALNFLVPEVLQERGKKNPSANSSLPGFHFGKPSFY